MNLSEIVDKIQKTLGKEESAKIGDDLANILIVEESNKNEIKTRDENISRLKNDKELLIQANGNLLLQVPQSKEDDSFFDNGTKKEAKNEPFDFRSIFENGKFKR